MCKNHKDTLGWLKKYITQRRWGRGFRNCHFATKNYTFVTLLGGVGSEISIFQSDIFFSWPLCNFVLDQAYLVNLLNDPPEFNGHKRKKRKSKYEKSNVKKVQSGKFRNEKGLSVRSRPATKISRSSICRHIAITLHKNVEVPRAEIILSY